MPMVLTKWPETEEQIGDASNRLRWVRDEDDLVAGRYRIRLLEPGRWETTYRERPLRLDPRRSMAVAGAEHHYRGTQRIQQIVRWGSLAGVAFVVAAVATHWFSLLSVLLLAVAVWVVLGSAVRVFAAANRSLLDPYRFRDSWEPPDWWIPRSGRIGE
jgi:hypothetical protein